MIRRVSALSVVATTLTLAAFAGEPMRISSYTIDGGGVMRSGNAHIELSGTIGQPDAGVMTGEGFKLTGGFWFEVQNGDCNENNVLDLFDHQALVACLSGPNVDTVEECLCLDIDQSGAVNLWDYGLFQRSLSDPQP